MLKKLDEAYLNHIKTSMMDSFTDFIAIADSNRNIICLNPAAYRMMGYSPDEELSITRTEHLHAKDFDKFAKEVIQPSVFAKGSWTGISYINHKDGSPLTVEMTVFPLYGPNKEEYGTVIVMRDVNELTRMNERLKKSTELFQKVIDSIKIGIVLINMESNQIEMVNNCAADMLQMTSGEIIGQKCYNILCHRDLAICPHVNERDKDVIVAERFIERQKTGEFLPIIKSGSWITLDEKEYLVDTFVDITIQKELESRLHEAKTLAESASRSKSEFLSRMSHEMRTPLNAIIGMTQISDKTDDAAKLKACLETIKVSSAHLLSLINDVLDLSKIEEGKLELVIEPFSIQTLVRNTLVLVEPKAREKQIVLDVRLDEDIPQYLMGDPLRLSQILLNFLSNAVKFTPEQGRVSLSATIISRADTSVNIRFAVADTGIGISEEQMARLFTPFVQADNSITRKYGGTGLGLVISKRIINLMGADITVFTRQNEGSTFQFDLTLPLPSAGAFRKTDMEELPGDVSGLFAGKTALLADDVEINRIIARELLNETGLRIDEAEDGREALEKASETLYDIILMDIQMPVMDGYEATERIRLLPEPLGSVPIIAMSANVFKEDVARSLAIGMNAHVGKPIDVAKTIAAIHRLVNRPDSGEDGTRDIQVAFRRNVQAADFDKNYFNYDLAAKLHDNNDERLATLCSAFIKKDYFGKIKSAIESKDYEEARNVTESCVKEAQGLCLTSLVSYAANVHECLKREKYEYAGMYVNDLEICYRKTCETLLALLL